MAYTKPKIGTLTSLSQVDGNIKPDIEVISQIIKTIKYSRRI